MTEKNYNPEQKNVKAIKQQEKIAKAPIIKNTDEKIEKKSTEEPTKETKKQVQKKKAPKKTEVVVNARNVPLSTKYAVNICRFIKNKTIAKALENLEEVIKMKKAVPMRGEYAHKKSVKGLASGSGKYPVNAAKAFITILKSLRGNAINHDLENPVIITTIANKASEPFARFGKWSRKRTHVTLIAKSKKEYNKKTKVKNKEKK